MARPPRLAAASLALAAAAVLALAPVPAAATAPSLRGAATHPLWSSSSVADFDRELDLLAQAGANVVRIDIDWSTLEAAGKGSLSSWYVQKADTFLAHARARGLGVIATFWATPCWASSAPDDVKQGCGGTWWARGVQHYPPSDPANFADAAAWVAARWGEKLTALEIWNEPNCSCFFKSAQPVTDYATLLKGSYVRVKQVAPRLQVIGPSMLWSDGDFLQALYQQGAGGYFDGVSSRPFSQGRDPNDTAMPGGGPKYSFLLGVPWVREVMVANGDAAKKLWFTEIGWSSCAPGGTSQWCVSHDLQARYIADALRIIRDRWDFVEAVSVYNLRNKSDDPNDRESQMGLLQRDFTPKPAWAAFGSALADLAANPAGLPPPQAAATPAPAPADTAPPLVSGLSLRPRSFRPGRGRDAGATVAFSLSEAAQVEFWVERTVPARRHARPRWRRLRARLERAGLIGVNRFRFDGRLGRRSLGPGRYRLLAAARDPAGNRSPVSRAPFRIER
jgi:polysaccharide biosynthesis protein PslG